MEPLGTRTRWFRGLRGCGGHPRLRSIGLGEQVGFGSLPSVEENLRRLIPAVTLMLLGVQGVFSSFFLSVLGLKTIKSIR